MQPTDGLPHIFVPADSGNITVLEAASPGDIRLAITPDGKAKFHQWFYFGVAQTGDIPLTMHLTNAGSSSYTAGWTDYQAVCSYDLEHWFRVPTRYADKTLTIEHRPEASTAYYAYFAPYPVERYRRFIGALHPHPDLTSLPLGHTLDGEPLDLLRLGTPGEEKRKLWVIARQHPGETMGSWWMEGFLPRLLDPADAVGTALRQQAVTYIVPLVNIDGARRGHLRTNAAGTDLNRAWAAPDPETSPEVLAIRGKMDALGCDFFLDVHGDEAIANNFIAGAEGIPLWSQRHQAQKDHFVNTLAQLSPAFQTVEGYPISAPGTANLKIAANQIAQRFDCLSMTLEMPFKDAKTLPDPEVGWSPARCADLGRSCVDAIWAALPTLR